MSPRISREASQQQTRQRLLDAAFSVFSERGYHAASIDSIAEEAGFSKGAVYSNFASKEELFLALLDHLSAEQMKGWDKVKTLLDPQPATPDQAAQEEQQSDLTYVEYIQQHKSWILLQLEFMTNALRDEKMRVEVASRLRSGRQLMREYLAAAHAANNTTSALPLDNLPLYMFSFEMGLALQTLLDPEVIPENAYTLAMRTLLR